MGAGVEAQVLLKGTTAQSVVIGDAIQNCLTASLSNNTPVIYNQQCVNTDVIQTVVVATVSKSVAPTTPVPPEGILTWKFNVLNDPFVQHTSPIEPQIIDLLPTRLTYVSNSLSFVSAGSLSTGCPAASDFGVKVEPNYIDGRTAVIASTADAADGGTGASIPDNNSHCLYSIETTVNPGVASGTYGGTPQGVVGDSTYPISPTYEGNGAYLFSAASPMNPADDAGETAADSSNINKDGNTAEGLSSATSDFQVSESAALDVSKQVKGDQDTNWIGSAEQDPSLHGTSSPGGTVSYQVILGDNGNEPESDMVAYDLLPNDNLPNTGSTGTNTGVTSVRYDDPNANANYKNQWIPTMTGPITPPVGDPVTILYSYKVTNIGNVDLSPATVTDPMLGLSAIRCPVTSLAPQAVETCTATYTTTQANVSAGSAINVGTATGVNLADPSMTGTTQVNSTVIVPYVAVPPPALESAISPTQVSVTG